jgi:PAS domain S-box-containing protein
MEKSPMNRSGETAIQRVFNKEIKQPLKTKTINFVLMLLILTGLFIVLSYQMRIEEKDRIKDIYAKGKHLVSLIALQPTSTFKHDQQYFLRTLMEYSTKEGLTYCYIVNQDGTPFLSFILPQSSQIIQNHLKTSTTNMTGMVYPPYEIDDAGGRIYEFSKPLFENGVQTGMVRIGLALHPLSIFTRERISLIGMIFFFISAAVILVYFGILQAIKPLGSLFSSQQSSSTKNLPKTDFGKFLRGDSINGMMQEVQTTLIQLKRRLKKIELNNKGLASQVGVAKYEKNQIVNILNTIKSGVVIMDTQGDVVHINDYLLKHIGKTREEAIDMPIEDVFPDPELVKFISQQENLEQFRSANHIELSLSAISETDIFSITCLPIYGESNQIGSNLLTFNNITSQKEAEKNTVAFVAHLSHELMTPLTTIQSYSEMLMEGEIEDMETQKEFFNTINKETGRLTRLIKDLLSLSRIEMGRLTLNKDIIKSGPLFEDCIVSIEGSAKKKGITIERHIPDNFPIFMGDKDLLKGALINILGNAVKYTQEKGTIDFGLRIADESIVFDISDTGYGMSEEDLGHIFDKFYRSSNPDVVDKQGTGLGLCIASEIIGLHGGKIETQSQLGKGTYFIVSLPLEEYYIDE